MVHLILTAAQDDALTDGVQSIRDGAHSALMARTPIDAAEHLDAIDGAVADLRETLGLRVPLPTPGTPEAPVNAGPGIVDVWVDGTLVGLAEREDDGVWRVRVRAIDGGWLAPTSHGGDKEIAVLTLGWRLAQERG